MKVYGPARIPDDDAQPVARRTAHPHADDETTAAIATPTSTPAGPSSPDQPTFAVNVRSSGSRKVSSHASHGSGPKISDPGHDAGTHRQRGRGESRGRRTPDSEPG